MTSPPTSNGILAVRPFVPAKDLAASLRFHGLLGFTATQFSESLVLLTIDGFGMLLQQFEFDAFARNYMMQLTVADLDAWWERIEKLDLSAEFGVRAPAPPTTQPWGLRVIYIFDPSGVLWHVTELSKS